MSLTSIAAAAASSKAAAALAAAALIAGGGSVAATAATGSANPAVWGRTVTSAVATCKAGLAQGQHGIGHCVSATAKMHGEQERAVHAQDAPSPAPTAPATVAPTAAPAAPGHSEGRPATLPTPAQSTPAQAARPTPHPTGRPSTAPGHGH